MRLAVEAADTDQGPPEYKLVVLVAQADQEHPEQTPFVPVASSAPLAQADQPGHSNTELAVPVALLQVDREEPG